MEEVAWQPAISFPCYTRLQVEEIVSRIEMTDQTNEPSELAAEGANKSGKFTNFPCMAIHEIMTPFIFQVQNLNRWYFGYDIDWALHLDHYTLNKYSEGNGQYGWHNDFASSSNRFDIKLTCVLNLSLDPFEGGDLIVHGLKEPPKFDTGMGIVLNPLVSHKVTPVTKGTRTTLSYFATGPSWK